MRPSASRISVGHADRVQLGHGAEHGEVGVVVGLAPELGGVGEQPDLAQAGDEIVVDPGPLGELGEGVAALAGAEEAFEAGAVDVDDGPDRCEREALGLEVTDAVEAFEVPAAVEAVAPLLGGRGK